LYFHWRVPALGWRTAAVNQLLSQREQMSAEGQAFRKLPVSTAALSKVVPEIQAILSSQTQSKQKHPQELLLAEPDVKLLGYLAEGPEGHDSPIIKYAKLINSKIVGRDLSNQSLANALKILKADQAKLNTKMDQLIKKVASADPFCHEVQDCQMVSLAMRDSKNLQEINLALYKSLKLSANDLPDLFMAKPAAPKIQERSVATSKALSGKDPVFWHQLANDLRKNRDSTQKTPYGKCSISNITYVSRDSGGHFTFKIQLPDQKTVDVSSGPHPTAETNFAKDTQECWNF
jgi:hypothetical protein